MVFQDVLDELAVRVDHGEAEACGDVGRDHAPEERALAGPGAAENRLVAAPGLGHDQLQLSNATIAGNVQGSGSLALSGAARVMGNVTLTGGQLSLGSSVTVGGNVTLNGGATFSIGPATTINGNVAINNLPAGSGQNFLCGSQVRGNLQFTGNGTSAEIGSPQSSCAGNAIRGNLQVENNTAAATIDGNTVGGNLQVQSNTASTQIVGNVVTGNLQCESNSLIAACTNVANQKQGQCAPAASAATTSCALASASLGFTALYPPTLYFTGTPTAGIIFLDSSPGGVAIGGAPPPGSSEASIGFAVTISAAPYTASGTFDINQYLSMEYPNSVADVGSIASTSIGGQPGYEFTFQNEEGGGKPVAVIYHDGYVYEVRYASTNYIAGFWTRTA